MAGYICICDNSKMNLVSVFLREYRAQYKCTEGHTHKHTLVSLC